MTTKENHPAEFKEQIIKYSFKNGNQAAEKKPTK